MSRIGDCLYQHIAMLAISAEPNLRNSHLDSLYNRETSYRADTTPTDHSPLPHRSEASTVLNGTVIRGNQGFRICQLSGLVCIHCLHEIALSELQERMKSRDEVTRF